MSQLEKIFKSYSVFDKENKPKGNDAIIYTRVSDISQLDNMSLAQQKKACEEFALRKGYTIEAYFGGINESAKSDADRKEFQRMLQFVKRRRSTACIIVYSYERFSRTGLDGASIAQDLLKKYGIKTLSVSQEIDPTTPMGQFYQNLQFLWGKP